jgi:hypothetical protein
MRSGRPPLGYRRSFRRAGFNGAELQVLIHDRVAGDAARYGYSKEGSRQGPLQLRYLLNELQVGRAYIRTHYVKPGEL